MVDGLYLAHGVPGQSLSCIPFRPSTHGRSICEANKRFRPTLFFLTVVVALFVVMRGAPNAEPQLPVTASSFLRYQTLEGYFLQDDLKTNPLTFDYVRRPID
jgi:hypothetical protein